MTSSPTLSMTVISVLMLSAACAPEATARAATTQGAVNAETAPSGHYCNMEFFTPEGLARHKLLVPKLAAAVREVRELDNGYAYAIAGDMRELGEFLDGARGCCPTVEYAVTFPPHSGTIMLRITGAAGAKEFIREEFDAISRGKDRG
jgi:hypothetical protein